jgi:hypothetical protein
MFTNEFEWDSTVTTILDESDGYEDIQLYIDDGGVFIRQFNENHNKYDLINMTHEMFYELMVAMKTAEGTYRTFFKKNEKK